MNIILAILLDNMAKELTSEERIHFSDLEQNFDWHVTRYREEVEEKLQTGKRALLMEEQKRLEDYLAIYHRGEVDDLRVNIDFAAAKIRVLKEVLERD
ncbi:MAG TPA: hypothetical protein ENH13_04285 [Euryarchaeota archaeon]|nr:hypothetical protein [Euryarchaeota archaeon]